MSNHIYIELVLLADLFIMAVYAYLLFRKVVMYKKALEREKKTASNMARGNIALRDQIEQLTKRLAAAGVKACDLEPVKPRVPVERVRT